MPPSWLVPAAHLPGLPCWVVVEGVVPNHHTANDSTGHLDAPQARAHTHHTITHACNQHVNTREPARHVTARRLKVGLEVPFTFERVSKAAAALTPTASK